MFFQNVTHSFSKSLKISIGLLYGSLARAKPPVDVTTGYQRTEPAKIADMGWGEVPRQSFMMSIGFVLLPCPVTTGKGLGLGV